MKKYIKILVLSLLCVFMTGCGNSEVEVSTNDVIQNQENETIVEDSNNLEKENETLKEEVEEKLTLMQKGEILTVEDKAEFQLDYTNITDDVRPPQPASYYSHYEADSGKTYVDICVAYKNLATSAVDADEIMSGTLVYDGKYEYRGFSIIEEDSRGDFTYTNITEIDPLSTEYVHYLFEIPEELAKGTATMEAKMTIADEKYRIVVKEATASGETAGNAETITLPEATEVKTGEIKKGEVMNTGKNEFFVEYSKITDDVMPPQPDSYYSHYEAESGKVYVEISIGYKNLSPRAQDADEIVSGKLIYDGKYEYTGFTTIEEDSRGDFTYTNITSIDPLTQEYIHYLFEVPEEVEKTTGTLEFSFSIDGNAYTYKVR